MARPGALKVAPMAGETTFSYLSRTADRYGLESGALLPWWTWSGTRPRDWYEEMHERQRKAHSSRRIRVEHGIAHLKNWRALARHLGRREHMSDTVQAVAGLLSHQQTADLTSTRQR